MPPLDGHLLAAVVSWWRVLVLGSLFAAAFISLFFWAYVFPSALALVLFIAAMMIVLLPQDVVIKLWWLLSIYIAIVFVVEYFWAIRDSPLAEEVSRSMVNLSERGLRSQHFSNSNEPCLRPALLFYPYEEC